MKTHILRNILILLLLLSLLWGLWYFIRFQRYQAQVSALTLETPELAALPDGLYRGSYDADFVAATVEVRMESGRMAEIRILEHHQERGLPGEAVVDRVLEAQHLGVDAVTGATNSSRVIQKAVEIALTQAPQ